MRPSIQCEVEWFLEVNEKSSRYFALPNNFLNIVDEFVNASTSASPLPESWLSSIIPLASKLFLTRLSIMRS